jgi:glycosyltransferase involved in cell wall biosynthesis
VYGRGGAAGVAANLVRGLRERGQQCWHAVGYAEDAPADVVRLDAPAGGRAMRLARRLKRLWKKEGLEDFDFPRSRRLLALAPEPPDIVHCHNLHGGYFDLRYLARLSRRVPTFLTLHDAWLLSGHCAHSFECERWRTGCGSCPDLTIPPAIPVDRTAENWARKAALYRESRLMVATPSHWLMQKVEASMLVPGIVEAKVIPNGVDLATFNAREDRASARRALGLEPDSLVLVFAAHGIRQNVWKDFRTLRAALGAAAERLRKGMRLHCLALGEDAPPERIGAAEVTFVPYVAEPPMLARYFRAADMYVHAARVDTFPTTVLEALACGTPVVATAVGGIPEQVRSLDTADASATGMLTPPGDPQGMADAIVRLALDKDLLDKMGRSARRDAERRFDMRRQTDEYLAWYRARTGVMA